jgi:cobyrinic acid a,c-diamide synthase
VVAALFAERARTADISVIEGNRGLFDGKDVEGTCSTAELARQLSAPVILVLDATKMTRTAAAIVAGCKAFEPGLASPESF